MMAGTSGWGKQDYRKKQLSRCLELANVYLAEARDHIHEVFQPDSSKDLQNRVYRLQEQIREIKALVKQ